MKKSNTPYITLIVAILLAALAVFALIFTDPTTQSTPSFVGLMGFITVGATGLLASWNSEQLRRDVQNGVIEKKVQNALNNIMDQRVASNPQDRQDDKPKVE